MKNLTDYIKILLEDIGLPVEVELKDNVYYISVVVDLKQSWTLYKNSVWYTDNRVVGIRVQLKKYLRQVNFKVSIKHINYPKDSSTSIDKEYTIKPKL